MENLTTQLNALQEKLGRSFLVAGYIPGLLFVLAHQIVFFPRWQTTTTLLLQAPAPEENLEAVWRWTYLIDQTITLLLVPLLLGMILMAFNTMIIKAYEGEFAWQKRFLLRFWQRRNERQNQHVYGDLPVLKEEYTRVLAELAQLPVEADRQALEQQRISLALELQAQHDKVPSSGEWLPRRAERIKPTALGNVFASMEEYPYERYGMDGVLYWPRLRPLLEEDYSNLLVNTKMILDLFLNLSLLAFVFGAESAYMLLTGGKAGWGLLWIGLGALCAGYVFYRGAVQTARSLGATVALCFDYFRVRILDKFGLARPDDLETEQTVWLQLGQFLRRGEGFYYPSQHRQHEEK